MFLAMQADPWLLSGLPELVQRFCPQCPQVRPGLEALYPLAPVLDPVSRWFLEPGTRMNPRLDHAETRLGHDHDRGHGRGVIQGQPFWYLLEGIKLLETAELLDDREREGLKAWFTEYLDWLLASRQGRWARGRTDFHGTWYEVQLSAVAAFVGAGDEVLQAMYRTEEKIHFQLGASRRAGRWTAEAGSNLERVARLRPVRLQRDDGNGHRFCQRGHADLSTGGRRGPGRSPLRLRSCPRSTRRTVTHARSSATNARSDSAESVFGRVVCQIGHVRVPLFLIGKEVDELDRKREDNRRVLL